MDTSYYVDTTYGVSQTTGLLSLVAGIGIFIWILGMALSIFFIVAMWKVFVKAGKPGWAALIPIYNIYIMCEIAEKEWWYILLLCVPILNIYAMFVIYDGIAKKFGKTTGFTIGMMFLPYIFFPILAFGKNNNVESTTQPVANENADINNNYSANTVQDINNTQPSNNINQSINMVDTSNSPVQNVVPGVGLQEQQIIEPNVVEPAMMGAEPVAEQMPNVAPTFENNVNQVENMVDTSNSPVQNVVTGVGLQEQQNVQPAMMGAEPVAEQMTNVAPTFENNVNQAENMVDTSNSPVQNVAPDVNVQEQPIVEQNVVEQAMMGAEPVAEQMTNVAPMFDNNINQVENMVDTSNSPVQNVVPEVGAQEQQNVQPVVDNKSETHTSLWSNNNNNQ
ncbi:MAG: DUF5684 domain-containing protein [Candidatus Aphodocola sp.]